MENERKILIVTPTLGIRHTLLSEVISSVQRHAPGAQHIISCPSLKVTELKNVFPNLNVVADQGREGGLYGAINNGVAAAEPWEWFTYINDDDLLYSGFQELCRQHIAMHDETSIAYGRTWYIDEAGRRLCRFPVERNQRYFRPLLRQGIPPLIQQGTLLSRKVMDALGGYDVKFRIAADHDLFARALCAGFGYHYYPLEVGAFRLLKGQISGNREEQDRELAAISKCLFSRPESKFCDQFARWRFRLLNADAYAERTWRIGWRRSESMLTQSSN